MIGNFNGSYRMDSPALPPSSVSNRAVSTTLPAVVAVAASSSSSSSSDGSSSGSQYLEQISVEVEKWLKYDQQCSTYSDPSHYYSHCNEIKLHEKLKVNQLQFLRDLAKEFNERSWMYEKKKKY
jgi:hypothetical protein